MMLVVRNVIVAVTLSIICLLSVMYDLAGLAAGLNQRLRHSYAIITSAIAIGLIHVGLDPVMGQNTDPPAINEETSNVSNLENIPTGIVQISNPSGSNVQSQDSTMNNPTGAVSTYNRPNWWEFEISQVRTWRGMLGAWERTIVVPEGRGAYLATHEY